MDKEFLIEAGKLANCIKALKPFISGEETRYYLGGIYFELDEESDVLNMVATDGIKLCVLNVPIDRQELFDRGTLEAIIPAKALDTILAMLKGIQKDFHIAMTFTQGNVFVNAGDEKGDFKLIDATYPNYRAVIPKSKPKFTIGFSRVQAKEALAAISTHPDKEGLAWEMVDERSPTIIRAENKLVVVMPMIVTIPGEVSTELGTPAE